MRASGAVGQAAGAGAVRGEADRRGARNCASRARVGAATQTDHQTRAVGAITSEQPDRATVIGSRTRRAREGRIELFRVGTGGCRVLDAQRRGAEAVTHVNIRQANRRRDRIGRRVVVNTTVDRNNLRASGRRAVAAGARAVGSEADGGGAALGTSAGRIKGD